MLIVGHTLASGFNIPRTHRQHYLDLTQSRDRLAESEQRVSAAVEAERRSIAAALEDAPIADIAGLLATLGAIRELRRKRCIVCSRISRCCSDRCPASPQVSAKTSHGVFPDLLRSGLSEALSPLFTELGAVERFDVLKERFAPNVEAALS